MGLPSLYLQNLSLGQRRNPAQGRPLGQRDLMDKHKCPLFRIVGGAAVIQQHRGIHGHLVKEAPGHGKASAGIHRKRPALRNKIPDGLQVPLRNGAVLSGQCAVKIHRQQYIRKTSHFGPLFIYFFPDDCTGLINVSRS